ncbi:hypothetical protein [Bradyrhizobium sp. NP1]|uniref:hypothetical protein n=1 Tax=Bradyrhizobium sp. NP1 TaxID=3049772 RepID=UPI0025A538A3|nr:hypothetical protein [Bradyrhizobium sp. NP1]WJR76009.1 hypothetical protein QOU61_24975 [Bradyrhizobium sp. NP1]
MAKPEQALWRAVIDQAITDASGKMKCKEFDRAQALDWLLKPNRNFNEVCALADLEPDHVRAAARKAIEKYRSKSPRKHSGAKLYEFNGRTLNIQGWVNEIGCSYSSLYARLVILGWTIEAAVTTPFMVKRRSTKATAPPGVGSEPSKSGGDRSIPSAQDSA